MSTRKKVGGTGSDRPKRGAKGPAKPRTKASDRKTTDRDRTAGGEKRGPAKGAARPKSGGRGGSVRGGADRDERRDGDTGRSSGPRREGGFKDARGASRGAGKPSRGTRDEPTGERAGRSSGPRRESSFKDARGAGRSEGRPSRGTRDEPSGERASRSSGPGRESGFKDAKGPGRSSGKPYGKASETRRAPRPAGPDRIPKDGEKKWSTAGPRHDGPPGKRNWRDGDEGPRRPYNRGGRIKRENLPNPDNDGLMRLNKYLAQAGIASRREADALITSGAVTVNGEVVTEMGTKVKPEDIVHFGGQKLSTEQKRYVLLNKPKDTITTTDDPRDRHTVMTLIAKACTERLYPVGRLDRNTTGVLLMTNDGDLAKKLTHPSHGAEKLYHATLDRSITVEELHKLVEGVHLDDGPARADEVSFVGASKREVGMKIHMGRNRIVRRMFQALGAEVVKLDRVMFAGLTKKELQRGFWRHLTEKEVTWLKQMRDAPKDTNEERGGRRTRLSQGSE